jgi:hypothetical protein
LTADNQLTFYTLAFEPTAHLQSVELNGTTTATTATLNFPAVQSTGIGNLTGYVIVRENFEFATLEGLNDGSYPENTPGSTVVAVITDPTQTQTIDQTGLFPGTEYWYAIVPFGGAAEITATLNYRLASDFASIMVTTSVVFDPPTIPASNIVAFNRAPTSLEVSFTKGDGNKHLVAVKLPNNANNPVPADGAHNSGEDLDNTGVFVAGITTGNTVIIPGLTPGTEYTIEVFELNDASAQEDISSADAKFLSTLDPANGNPNSFFTLADEPLSDINFFSHDVSGTTITLQLPAVHDPASGFVVVRSTSPVNDLSGLVDGATYPEGTVYVAALAGDASSYTDSDLSQDTDYFYSLIPFNTTGFNATINYRIPQVIENRQVHTEALASQPENPAIISFTQRTDVSLALSFAPSGADGYMIVRMGGNILDEPLDRQEYTEGSFMSTDNKVIFSRKTSQNPVTFTDPDNLLSETSYTYAVFAFNGDGATRNYHNASVTGTSSTFATEPVNNPTTFDINRTSNTQFTLNVNEASNTPDGYVVVRRSDSDPVFVPIDAEVYSADDPKGSDLIVYSDEPSAAQISVTQAGLNPGTTYHYAVYAFNGDGISRNYKTSAPLLISAKSDITPPTITNSTPGSVNFNTPIDIAATVTDASGIDKVFAYHKKPGADVQFTKSQMVANGTTYSFQVIQNDIGDLGIEYYFEASDIAGNLKSTEANPAQVHIKPADNRGIQIPYASFGVATENYRIVSVPLVLTNASAKSVFEDDLGAANNSKWRVYHYENGSNSEAVNSQITPGKGYWLIAKEAPSNGIFSGPGESVATEDGYYNIQVNAGWNQIGNPFNFKLDLTKVKQENAGIQGNIMTFTGAGGYAQASILNPGEGVFVKTNGGTLKIPASAKTAGRLKTDSKLMNSISATDWEVELLVKTASLQNNISGIGMRADASEDGDFYDNFTLPRFNDYLEVNHGKMLDGDHYTKDVVPTATEKVWEFEVKTNISDESDVSISWDNTYFGNNEKVLILWDVNQQVAIDMREHNQYHFNRNTSGGFRIIYGDSEFSRENTRVNQLLFHNIIPNPVGEEAKISFTLPQAEHVTIEVMDVTGKKAERIFDGSLEEGYHEIVYRTGDHNTAKGMYIVQLQAGKGTLQKRMILK